MGVQRLSQFHDFRAGLERRLQASNARRGASDRREERYKHNTNAFYVQGGWRVVVVVVVVDAVDLVLGRARRARAAAAARRKSRERVHETEARRVEEAILGRRVAFLLGVARRRLGRDGATRVARRANASEIRGASAIALTHRRGLTRVCSSSRAAPQNG